MNNIQKTIFAFAFLAGLSLAAVPSMAGQVENYIAAGQGAGAGTITNIYYTDEDHGWTVKSADRYERISLYLDPNVGPWEKYLYPQDSGFNPGEVYMLKEVLMVRYSPWADYHETILTPGWEWYEDMFGVAWSFSSTQGGIMANHVIDGKLLNVDWTFTPEAAVDSLMTITKYVRFTGDGGDPTAPLVVAEYPTANAVPEPSAFVLLVVGGIAALGYGWRRLRMK